MAICGGPQVLARILRNDAGSFRRYRHPGEARLSATRHNADRRNAPTVAHPSTCSAPHPSAQSGFVALSPRSSPWSQLRGADRSLASAIAPAFPPSQSARWPVDAEFPSDSPTIFVSQPLGPNGRLSTARLNSGPRGRHSTSGRSQRRSQRPPAFRSAPTCELIDNSPHVEDTLIEFGFKPRWRNWQTRQSEGLLPERACGFKSRPGHRRSHQRTRFDHLPLLNRSARITARTQ